MVVSISRSYVHVAEALSKKNDDDGTNDNIDDFLFLNLTSHCCGFKDVYSWINNGVLNSLHVLLVKHNDDLSFGLGCVITCSCIGLGFFKFFKVVCAETYHDRDLRILLL